MALLLQPSGSSARAPEGYLDGIGRSLPCAGRGSDVPASVNATGCRGPVALSPAPLLGPALWLWQSRCWASHVPGAAPPPSPALPGAARPRHQAFAEDGMRARHACEVAEDHRNAALPSARQCRWHLKKGLVPPSGWAPADSKPVSARARRTTTPRPWKAENKQTTAQRRSVSLDNGSPHTGSARTST
jgi:hypothetical protein